MENMEPAKAPGLGSHLLVDRDRENVFISLSNLHATICCADSQGGCRRGEEYKWSRKARNSLMPTQDRLPAWRNLSFDSLSSGLGTFYVKLQVGKALCEVSTGY